MWLNMLQIKVTMKRMRGIELAKLIIWFKSIHISIIKHTNNNSESQK